MYIHSTLLPAYKILLNYSGGQISELYYNMQ